MPNLSPRRKTNQKSLEMAPRKAPRKSSKKPLRKGKMPSIMKRKTTQKCFEMAPRKASRKSLRKGKMPSTFCVICKRNFTSRNVLKQHNTKHHFFRHCPNCRKTYQRTRTYIYHLRSHLNDHPYQCTRCLASFNQKRDLLSHKREERSSESFYCERCHKVFPFRASLNRHRMARSGPPYGCKQCVATFKNVPDAIVHLKNHVIRCFACPKEIVIFSSEADLIDHLYRVHKPDNSDPDESDESETIERCVSTGAVNLEDDSDSDSMEDLLSSSGLDSDSDGDNYQEDAVVPVHNLRRKDKFICFICYDLYPSCDLLKSHMKNHNWYPCNSCPKFFWCAEILKKHKCDFAQVPSFRCKNCNSECENCKTKDNISELNPTIIFDKSIAAGISGLTDYTDVDQRNSLINFIHNIKSQKGLIDFKSASLVYFHNINLKIILNHPGVNRLFPRECIPELEELYSKLQELSQSFVVQVN